MIQHLSIEPPALIGEMLCDAGHDLHYIHVDKGDVLPENTSDFSGVVIMGGPQSANDAHLAYIDNELRWLTKTLADGMPMLGICLGAQMMAKASAAEISRSPLRELGWYPVFPTPASGNDPLFADLPTAGLQVFQWHGETFSLPQQASLIATHPDVPQQIFRLKQAQYGLQCHIEVDEALIEQWIDAGKSERTHLGACGLATLRHQTAQHLEAMRLFCRRMIGNWLALID
ncbi:MAG: type 1 glutamine amidotransferase [Mariprofundaceae bacterium]|nr:type 1 glutamine amidotransferase [Mariprofundaceae bacterium]